MTLGMQANVALENDGAVTVENRGRANLRDRNGAAIRRPRQALRSMVARPAAGAPQSRFGQHAARAGHRARVVEMGRGISQDQGSWWPEDRPARGRRARRSLAGVVARTGQPRADARDDHEQRRRTIAITMIASTDAINNIATFNFYYCYCFRYCYSATRAPDCEYYCYCYYC